MRIATLFKYHMIIAGIALAVIVFVSIGDVLMTVVTNVPIRGVYDIVRAAQLVMIFFTLPEVFRAGGNITVNLIDMMVGRRLVGRLRIWAAFLSAAFIFVVLVSASPVALDAFRFNEYMVDSGIPFWLIWIPLVYGLVMSLAAAIVEPFSATRPHGHHEAMQ